MGEAVRTWVWDTPEVPPPDLTVARVEGVGALLSEMSQKWQVRDPNGDV